MASKTDRLYELLSVYRKWLHLPDPGMVELALAVVAANRIPGDPVWLLLTGPPSSGKTETLDSLLGLHEIHSASTLTEAALLSGTGRSDRADDATGGLLREIGDSGVLVLKDFTSVLSMNRDKLKALLAALREVFDGAWTRPVGVDGGRKLHWQGKLGLIGGVTSTIDSHHSVMNAMGQRFALYRLPKIDAHAQAKRALEKIGNEEEMRAELRDAVAAFFSNLDVSNPPVLSATDHEWIIALTTLIATCRSSVERDSYSREIEHIHDSEAPARLSRMLAQLWRGAILIGIKRQRVRELIVKVGLDCIPPVRRIALAALLSQANPRTLTEIADGTHYPAQTIRRALQDMECHGIVERVGRHCVAETWSVASHWRSQFEIARGLVPEK